MSALLFIRNFLQKKADWYTHCLICDGAPEVQVLGTNLEFFLCLACTRAHLEMLLSNDYILYGGEAAQRRVLSLTEQKML